MISPYTLWQYSFKNTNQILKNIFFIHTILYHFEVLINLNCVYICHVFLEFLCEKERNGRKTVLISSAYIKIRILNDTITTSKSHLNLCAWKYKHWRSFIDYLKLIEDFIRVGKKFLYFKIVENKLCKSNFGALFIKAPKTGLRIELFF